MSQFSILYQKSAEYQLWQSARAPYTNVRQLKATKMFKLGLYITYIGYFSRLIIFVVLGCVLKESFPAFLHGEIMEGIAYLIYACVGGPLVYVIGNIVIGVGVTISQKAIENELD